MYIPKTMAKCLECGDEIYSATEGRYTACSCDKTYIDETEFYCRIGGDNVSSREVKPQEFIWTTLDGRKIKIEDLPDGHAISIIIHLEEVLENDNSNPLMIKLNKKRQHGYMYYAIKDELKRRNIDII